ncbi:helicase associated domain-containing protein [Streptomyces sp. WI04-05B]|uniref:helicase associated domain-containing protein n=1 Tax=Streptomyces TaxID=1883 RepID=UPI0029ADD5ED|nr:MULTISPECIES: helicase associated domain-containing protein [unclassified Streptomyces]MDX2548786.1 helicase associated domain-containing protein [Streptomyces sp. WI04-05B]MDX2589169.1 helicase associated domain-containing protein [Streptomyces sp. WI04-05A]MDX3745745.1 helicase associated domain-containing protein [Streptomyces sp. AK08-02]
MTTTPCFDTDVAHARSYSARYGHLAARSREEHEGFPIGYWLAEHRQRARKKSGTSPQARVLASMDPWWNPPWPMRWQYAYHHARTHPDTSRATQWITAQRQAWPLLHPDQQQLLANLGVSMGR